MKRVLILVLSIFLLAVLTGSRAAAQEQATAATQNTCLDCHASLDPPFQVTADQFGDDIHSHKGLTCASCHGGNPTVADMDAMSPKAGFKGHIDKKRVPELCGSCHSDAAYMRGYNPSLRTDELAQYKNSQHGKLLAKGDTKVAVCTDCHGVHNLRAPNDPKSKVYATNVATTCSGCHANRDYMKPYGIPTDQFASYEASVHYEAMATRGDLSAPTCTTCHGNHGAAPPGVASVEHVCSTCHVFQAQEFDKSPHKAAFAAAGMPSCVTCHSNHRILHPTDTMVGTGPQAICTNCHSQGDPGYAGANAIASDLATLVAADNHADDLLDAAERKGVEVSGAKLEQLQAHDALTKARVKLHTFTPAAVHEEIKLGMKISDKGQKAGEEALREGRIRRVGLGASLTAIFLVLVALGFYIKEIEKKNSV